MNDGSSVIDGCTSRRLGDEQGHRNVLEEAKRVVTHDLATSRKSEMKLKRELEKIQDRRSHERKEIKSMREALRVMREEARNHEKVTIDLEKKHEGEMRMMVEEKYRLEVDASRAMDEVLRKVKRITMVDEDCGERNGTSGDANEYENSS